MKPRLAPAYVESLFESGTYEALVELSALVGGCSAYDPSRADCGLGEGLFAFNESLAWLAQSARSGAATYFESTSSDRQASMLQALRTHAPADIAAIYEQAMTLWLNKGSLADVDQWVQDNESKSYTWLAHLVRHHRSQFVRLVLAA